MKKILYIAAAVATLVSCNKENNEIAATGNVAVEFTNGVITRASGTNWATTDKIGIYMFNTGATTVIEEKGNIQYYNSKAYDPDPDVADYTSATFKVVDANEIIYYPQGDVTVDFLAYYPYSDSKVSATDFIYEVDVNTANQADQTLIDLMVSNNLTGKSLSTTAALSLEFTHALSQLNFVVNPGVGTPDLTGLTITVGGLKNTASYDLTDGTIVLGDTSDLAVSNLSAIIIPQTADLTFTFTTTDNPTGFTTTKDDMEFNPGESTTLTFKINRTSVSLEGESTINGWTPVDGGSTDVY